MNTLRQRLASVPVPSVAITPAIERAIADSVHELGSDAALASLARDPYWPKWDSPWWHMLLLHEVGEARQIPERAVTRMIEALDAMPIKVFPIHPEDVPAGMDPDVQASCHCALGSVYQVLSACGVDVDRALPWIKPWFPRYQLADGGLTCDYEVYGLVGDDGCPSSMVGTVAPFEAMLLGGPEAWAPDQRTFLERGARFLEHRQLRLGSTSRHNAQERVSQDAWLKLCFPRFYFYDVLRGLSALARWAEASGRSVPASAVTAVIEHLVTTFPEGIVRRGRRAVEGVSTRLREADGRWTRGHPASRFPLLDATSAVDEACPFLTREWSATRALLIRLIDEGRLTVSAPEAPAAPC